MEWDELIAHTKESGPFNQEGKEGENEEDEKEDGEEEQVGGKAEAEEEIRNMASPVAINDDFIVNYLKSAAIKDTRSIAEDETQS